MAFTNPYLQGVYDDLAKRNPEQKSFAAVEEVLESLEPVVAAHPEYEKAGLIERLVEPERVIMSVCPGSMTLARSRSTAATVCSSTLPSAPTREACASTPLSTCPSSSSWA